MPAVDRAAVRPLSSDRIPDTIMQEARQGLALHGPEAARVLNHGINLKREALARAIRFNVERGDLTKEAGESMLFSLGVDYPKTLEPAGHAHYTGQVACSACTGELDRGEAYVIVCKDCFPRIARGELSPKYPGAPEAATLPAAAEAVRDHLLCERIKALEEGTAGTSRLDRVEERSSAFLARLEGHEARLDVLEKPVDVPLEKRVDALSVHLEALSKTFDRFDRRINADRIEVKREVLEEVRAKLVESFPEIKEALASLPEVVERLKRLEKRIPDHSPEGIRALQDRTE